MLNSEDANSEIIFEKEFKNIINTQDVLLFKDVHMISDLTYNAFRIFFNPNLPTLYKIKAQCFLMDKKVKIASATDIGVKLDINTRITEILNNVNIDFHNIDKFRIKLCVDSTNVCKKVKLLNLNFSVLEGILL